jgi:hypothetical protein
LRQEKPTDEVDPVRYTYYTGNADRPLDEPSPYTSSDSGELIEAESHHQVCESLELVARGDMSQRQASQKLGCARKTIRQAIQERSELYRL